MTTTMQHLKLLRAQQELLHSRCRRTRPFSTLPQARMSRSFKMDNDDRQTQSQAENDKFTMVLKARQWTLRQQSFNPNTADSNCADGAVALRRSTAPSKAATPVSCCRKNRYQSEGRRKAIINTHSLTHSRTTRNTEILNGGFPEKYGKLGPSCDQKVLMGHFAGASPRAHAPDFSYRGVGGNQTNKT